MNDRYASMDDESMHKRHEELIRESYELHKQKPDWMTTSPEDVNAYQKRVDDNLHERQAIEREKERRRRVRQGYKFFRDS